MAIIKPSALVSAIAGTVGGVTFIQTASGQSARLWYPPPLRRSPAQSNQRNALAILGNAWRDLSATQRANWNTYAAEYEQLLTNRFGDTFSASGWNWFSRINLNRQAVLLSLRDDPPTDSVPAAPTGITVTFSAGSVSTSLRLDISPNPWTPGEYAIIHTGTARGGGRTHLVRAPDFLAYFLGAGTSEQNLGPAYIDRYGTAQEHDQLKITIRTQSPQGRRGQPWTDFLTVNWTS
jgi:hypothetical protein